MTSNQERWELWRQDPSSPLCDKCRDDPNHRCVAMNMSCPCCLEAMVYMFGND